MDLKIKDKSIKKFLVRKSNNSQIYKSFLRKLYLKYKLNSADGIFAIGRGVKFYKILISIIIFPIRLILKLE